MGAGSLFFTLALKVGSFFVYAALSVWVAPLHLATDTWQSPPGAPRLRPGVPGPELRGHPHRLGRLLGTFQPEVQRPRYGLTKPKDTHTVIALQYGDYADLWRDLRSATCGRDRLGNLVGPPGWEPAPRSGAGTPPSAQPIGAD